MSDTSLKLVFSGDEAVSEDLRSTLREAMPGGVDAGVNRGGALAELWTHAVEWGPEALHALAAAKDGLEAATLALAIVDKLLALRDRWPNLRTEIPGRGGPVEVSRDNREAAAKLIGERLRADSAKGAER